MDKKDKLCVLCPTRGRAKLLKRMLDSYEENSVQSDIYFSLERDDTDFVANQEVLGNKYKDKYWVMGDIGFVTKVNVLCEEYPGYAGYMILNDDQVIRTKGWDKILVNKLKMLKKESGHGLWILHWKDGINDEKLCQSFLSADMKDLLHSYYPKRYMRHLYTDNLYNFVGGHCEILQYVPEVFIEHLHVCKDPSLIDNSYRKTNSPQAYKAEGQEYGRWLQEKCIPVCTKILEQTGKNPKEIKKKITKITKEIKKMLVPVKGKQLKSKKDKTVTKKKK